MLSVLKKDSRQLKKYRMLVNQVNALEQVMQSLSDDELKHKTIEFKERLNNGEKIEDIQVEAFAVVREAADRVLGMRHFDVQLIGGFVLAEGNIAEMPTGEGKTLVASLPSYLRALEGKGVHVITVNEYLARRDKEQIGKIHEFLGLNVGLNLPIMDPGAKKIAYQADITYGVGTEFGFDFLRDNMVYDSSQRVQRPYHYAIIDEVDSVLIDEAKTPLIIANKTDVHADLSYLCSRIVKTFKLDEDFLFDEETKTVSLTEEGIAKIEKGFGIDNLYEIEHQTLYHYVIQALRARVMFTRDVDYIVKDGKVLLIDMFTGRAMEGRSLSNGLHQAIEAKEGLELTEENKTQASITIQNYFRQYPILSGMTGTAKTEENEFRELYNMSVVQIPTNKPVIRKDLSDRIYMTIEDKYKAVTKEVKKAHAKGQPVLVGTTSILQSEKVAEYLKKEGLEFELLNAKSVEQEVRLISLAGQKGQITVATNMAGRGTDIKLGDGVAELGGLYVIGTEKHESRRIDNQLKGRSGRQGDPGKTQFFISLEDDMFRRFAREELEKLLKHVDADDTGLVTHKKAKDFVERTQRICEGSNFSIREYQLKLDNVINTQRNTVYSLRNKVLDESNMLPIQFSLISKAAEDVIRDLCNPELDSDEWRVKDLEEKLSIIFPVHKFELTEEMDSIDEIHELTNKAIEHYFGELDKLQDKSEFQTISKRMLIAYIDHHWLDHIDAMEKLKEGIGLRGYSQEDPIRQYEREGLELFQYMYYNLEMDIARETASIYKKLTAPTV
ncbi:accessory Sec system translocase SecA2 [Bacillus litorisediminis]|uniref:accessory Sec system translocase SecA2 n=1 Tax=Bacillus litorisediminis TaxID=2922713 RepID=UPI001FB04320|nr:accessory Sec system translocase SecA2 [Bacillus litorisediminis]